MKHRLASQVRRSTDICIFCSLRWTREIPFQDGHRLSRRAYTSSVTSQAPASAAAARQEDDDDDFPLLKQNSAAASAWPTSSPIERSAPLPSTRSPPQRFSMNRSQNNQQPEPDQRFSIRGNRNNQRWTSDRLSQDSVTRPKNEQSSRQTVSTAQVKTASNNTRQGLTAGEEQGPTFRIRKAFAAEKDHQGGFRDQAGLRNASRTEHRSGLGQLTSHDNRDQRSTTHAKAMPQVHRPQFGLNTAESQNKTDQFQPIAAEPQRPPKSIEPVQRDPTLAEIRKLDIPIPGEMEEQEERVNARRGRHSGRFELEDEAEAELPAEQKTSEPSKGFSVRNKSQAFDFEMYEAEQALNGEKSRRKSKKAQKQRPTIEALKPMLVIPEFMSVQQLAQSMKVKVDDLVAKLEAEGFEGARYDHMLDSETSAMFADMYGFDPIAGEEEMRDLVPRPPHEDASALPPRPPIVTIMGHVDHGKTTILDWLRKSSVAAGEHGGITQHIGAFSVKMPGSERQITFLDTPGHEAFLDMRKRGANVTDIVVLVVAADDSVKPQTIEAIKHALQARVQLIVAINKVDKHDANIEQVKQDLTRHEIVVEDYGGDYQAIPVSGKTGQGMENLEEAIITLADVLDLRAEQDGPAEGQIIESKVTNAGRVATVLVRRGILRVGDFMVAGPTWGRVRTLRNDAGKLVQEAYPGDPVQVDGWRGSDPTAGLEVIQADNEQHAKDVVDLRHDRAQLAQAASDIAAINITRTQQAEARAKVLEWEAENRINTRRRRDNEGWVDADNASGPKKVHFVVKADVAGSVEAIVAAVSAIGNHEIRANVIHHGTGPVTESDIRMLATTGETGYAISFNQPVEGVVHSLAEAAGLQVLDHNIIYKVTDVVKEKVTEALPPLVIQKVLGEADVGKVFEVTVKKQKFKIAGCKVTKGTISRANQIRVIRNGETVYTGTLDSLKNVKKDVTEMRNGTECGMGFKDWEGIQEGDQVQCFEEKEEKRTLY